MYTADKKFTIDNIFIRSWQPYFWFFILSFLLFFQVFTFSEYTYFDDHFLIVESYPYIKSLSHIGQSFLEDVSHQGQGGILYRPILTISLILSAQISGMAPFGYHLIDILLHGASCCVLFMFLQTLGFKRNLSFWGTVFFCVHPVMTQAVAWIPGRNDPLLTLFILSGFIAYIKFLSTSQKKWYFIHLLCFAAAMFTKESALIFPLVVLLYSFALKKEKIFSLNTILSFAGWGVVFLNWNVMRTSAQIGSIGNKLQAAESILGNYKIILYYFGKILWPFDLAYAPVIDDIYITTGVISIIVLAGLIYFSDRRDWRMILFGAIWFVAFLAPTTFKQPKFCEHRIYIPFMGIVFILLSLSYSNIKPFLRKLFPYTLAAILLMLGWMSYVHTFDFKNYMTIVEFDAKSSPRDLGRYNIITRMLIPEKLKQEIGVLRGISQAPNDTSITIPIEKIWQTIDELKNELKTKQNDPELNHSLAITYFARGFFVSSEKYFQIASKENPHDAIIQFNLGMLYYRTYNKDKAERAWLKALEIDSSLNKTHLNLAYLYYDAGQYDLAWLHCQKAIQAGIPVFPVFANEIRKKIS